MSRSRQIGTLWESAIVTYLRQHWPHVERRALNGSKDRGDISGLPGIVIEAKSSSRDWKLPDWWRQTETERRNAQADHAVLWVKRQGKTDAARGWVIMDGETYVKLIKEVGW